MYIYTPISKNVVGENGEWHLSNRDYTTELWFLYLVCKNNDFLAWRKTDTAVRTANWPWLNMTVHQKFKKYSVPLNFFYHLRKIEPLPLNSEEYGQTIWLAI